MNIEPLLWIIQLFADGAAAVFALVAAVFWYRSAKVPLPEQIRVGSAPVDGYVHTYSKDLEDLGKALKDQAEDSRSAAKAAAASAFLLFASLGVRVYDDFLERNTPAQSQAAPGNVLRWAGGGRPFSPD